MDAKQFNQWLAAMKEAGLARSDAKAAELLGISTDTMVRLKRVGTDRRTALACRALYHRLEPWE